MEMHISMTELALACAVSESFKCLDIALGR